MEKERERNISVREIMAPVCALTGNQTGNLSVHRPALNPLSHTSQGRMIIFFKKSKIISVREDV